MNEAAKSPRLVGVGAVFIDDIVLPTGQTHMGQLGGGVVHALMGAAIWGERPGINAVIGRGLPDEAMSRLEQSLDTSGLIQLDIPQIRAWQLFEEDGTRRELYRVSEIAPFITGAQPEQLPEHYRTSQGFYLLQGFEGVRAWCKAIGGIVVWEPLQQIMIPSSRDSLRLVLQDCNIAVVSPNLAEARAVYGELLPVAILDLLLEDGAQTVALRMGEGGSLLVRRDTGERWHVPAVPVPGIIDQTGAGNTYCGGLLWGLIQGMNLQQAGAAGAVSASFCIESVGVVNPLQLDLTEREQRFRICKTGIVKF